MTTSRKLKNFNAMRVLVLLTLMGISLGMFIMFELGPIELILSFLVSLLVSSSVHIANQWERAIVLRMGKYSGLRGPGLFFIVPIFDEVSDYIDQRIRVTEFKAEQTLTKDTVPVNVDAVVYWTVWDVEKAALEVQDYETAISFIAQTGLRDIIGKNELSDLLQERDKIAEGLQVAGGRNNPTEITENSAKVATQITYNGSEPILEKGICWGTTQAPDIDRATKVKEEGPNLQFSNTIAPLAQLTAYYVRAYVVTNFGVFYGNEIQILILPEPVFGSVSDIDGNNYKTVVIGSQTWMAENLKSTRFNDGTAIDGLFGESDFKNTTGSAYTAYASNQSNIATYGLLYNGYAATSDKNVCPQGWHVPGNGDWYLLASSLGGLETAGGRMKAISPTWTTPNEAATNASGFSGLPGGSYCRVCISNNGVFADQGTDGYWWSAQTGVFFYLTNNQADLRTRNTGLLNDGMSIRCVKD